MATTHADGRVTLAYDEAVERLDVHVQEDGRRTVHTYLESAFALLGADWDESSVLALLREADGREDEADRIQETGPSAQKMRHGVAVRDDKRGMVFIAARGGQG
jgi:hypothetical protein